MPHPVNSRTDHPSAAIVLSMFRRFCVILAVPLLASCVTHQLATVRPPMQAFVDAKDISGAVTVVATKDRIVDCEAVGYANLETKEPMQTDSVFWIASMTKPVTATALLMLQDEGKLNVADPVAKYLPEFASLRTPSGKPANLTIAQLMTHTSGLGEGARGVLTNVHTLADLIPAYLAAPMQFEPGAKWSYCQSGINTSARIVEIVSGQPFDRFVQARILQPLGMTHSTFYPSRNRALHTAVGYKKNAATGQLEAAPAPVGFGEEGHPPAGQWRTILLRPGLCPFLSNAAQRRNVPRKAISQPCRCQVDDHRANRRSAHRIPASSRTWQLRNQLRLGHRRRYIKTATSRRGRNAVARHLWPRRRVGHAGMD